MIEKIHGVYFLICDICEDEEGAEEFPDFMEAVEYKKDDGWKSKREDGEWIDICPECQDV